MQIRLLPGTPRHSSGLAFQLQHEQQTNSNMKKNQVIALTALTAIAAGTALYFLQRRKHNRRKAFIANAGYETAYDVHYPIRYSRSKGKAEKN
jgi:hypothetical protein